MKLQSNRESSLNLLYWTLKLKLNHNLSKVKPRLLILNQFTSLLKWKEKLLINLLIYLVVPLQIILIFNPFLKQLEKIFKFKVLPKLEENSNQLKDNLFIKLLKKLNKLEYLQTIFINKILFNLYIKERMLMWILNKVLLEKL